jgi:glycosyltransferase involved in cell wall biosynthesis
LEVRDFLDSLLGQSRNDHQLIIVDQNKDERLVSIVAQYADRLNLQHIRTNSSGAARARNVGLEYARGELVGFPDDDCRYLPGYLDVVDHIFTKNPSLGGLTGQPTSEELGNSDESQRDAEDLGVFTVHNRCQEFTIWLRQECLGKQRYNERMGVGALTPWGADEGPDLLIRVIQTGCSMRYYPHLFVYHPDKTLSISRKTLMRAASYSRGRGCLWRLHHFPKSIVLNSLFRAAGGCAVYLITMRPLRSAYYFTIFWGMLRGLLMSRSELAHVASSTSLPKEDASV